MNCYKTQDHLIAQEISGRTPSLTPAHFLFWGAAMFIPIVFVIKTMPPNMTLEPTSTAP
jgi:hypothetical protein